MVVEVSPGTREHAEVGRISAGNLPRVLGLG